MIAHGISHIDRQIAPRAHTAMYDWHKFWSRKTWNVVADHIKAYCPGEGVVFDPFAGSGVAGLEAVKHGRKAILCEILPAATEIIRLTTRPVSPLRLRYAYERVEAKVKNRILSLYRTKCRSCGREIHFDSAVWVNGECKEIRYKKCPFCGDRRDKNCALGRSDKVLLKEIEERKIREWYPKQRLYYPNGEPFKEKQKYESLDELFTKRNLQALACLMKAIEQEPRKELQAFLKIGFSSMVHLCTRMMPVRPTRPWSSVWNEHSYWYASTFMEQNVWAKFESAILERQGLIRAKEESNKFFQNVRIARGYKEVLDGKADIYVYQGSCFDLMKRIIRERGEGGCFDYIFTDPPYGGSLQFGELGYLWTCWLKKDKGYLEKMMSDEVVENRSQGKSFDVYHSLLSRSFDQMYKLLKPGSYATVTFHNPTFKLRNATIYAAVFAGFEYQKVHHQELARPSAKSLLQPFGSAQGDFYFRFYKGLKSEKRARPEEIDEIRFERIVVETTTRVLAERGEETPYTIIINAIDPELAKRGYFSELKSGLDVKSVLKAHLGKEFELVSVKFGQSEGRLWWLKNPAAIAHLETVPLSERIEQTVLRQVQQKARVTFTEVWEAVSREFPNALTSDSVSIKGALEAYANPVSGSSGLWLKKPNAGRGEILRVHTEMLVYLAEIGKKRGYDIWIGKPEQSHKIRGMPRKSGELKQYVDLPDVNGILNIENPRAVRNIDLLWIENNNVVSSFEVEATTVMTEALVRGSNVDAVVPKYLVIPEERETQLLRKIRSPMFADRFNNDNWQVIFFQPLRQDAGKRKGRTDISRLVSKKIRKKRTKPKSREQLELGY